MDSKLDRKDLEILRELQKDCKQSSKRMSKKMQTPITTIYSKIKRMEDLGIIEGYNAVISGKKLGKGVTAFVLVSFHKERDLSQKGMAREISKLNQIQEVHIITGDWDLIVKVKEKDVESLGNFVTESLRGIKGVDKTLSLIVYHTEKETQEIMI